MADRAARHYHTTPTAILRAAAGGKCYKRKCGAARRCARFTDKPALRVPGVTTYGGCCKQCRTVTGCLRFHVGPSGCAIYRTRPQAPTVRSKRFTAAYRELCRDGHLSCTSSAGPPSCAPTASVRRYRCLLCRCAGRLEAAN